MPEESVRGKRVLEIGCGMGAHAELLTRRGARLTAIDRTPFAVGATTRRLEMKGLPHDVRLIDAEILPLPDREFDVVWSWGVIHHSRSTEAIVSQIARVLKPGGSLRLMVYYRPSLVYWLHCGFIRGVLMGQLLRKSVDQIYVDQADGFYARTFNKRELARLLGDGFDRPRFTVVGQKAELYPIPRTPFKVALENGTPDWVADPYLRAVGIDDLCGGDSAVTAAQEVS
jgi:SAM-dependent methyltransferase